MIGSALRCSTSGFRSIDFHCPPGWSLHQPLERPLKVASHHACEGCPLAPRKFLVSWAFNYHQVAELIFRALSQSVDHSQNRLQRLVLLLHHWPNSPKMQSVCQSVSRPSPCCSEDKADNAFSTPVGMVCQFQRIPIKYVFMACPWLLSRTWWMMQTDRADHFKRSAGKHPLATVQRNFGST